MERLLKPVAKIKKLKNVFNRAKSVPTTPINGSRGSPAIPDLSQCQPNASTTKPVLAATPSTPPDVSQMTASPDVIDTQNNALPHPPVPVPIRISGCTFHEDHRRINLFAAKEIINVHSESTFRLGKLRCLLQSVCIERLPGFQSTSLWSLYSPGAAYNSEERNNPPRCTAGTRTETLAKIDSCVRDGTKICWLHGPAGAGKSAIAQTVAQAYAGRGELAASFFFSRSAAGRNEMKHLFPTLAVQIAMSPALNKREQFETILHVDPCIADRDGGSIDLIARLFANQSPPSEPSESDPPPFIVIVDGLDECSGSEQIILAIHDLVNLHSVPLQFLIVSRPEAHLQAAFRSIDAEITKELSLYGDHGAYEDVKRYLQAEFSRIHNSERHSVTMRSVAKPWPSDDVIEDLTIRSGGYFVYPSVVIKFVDEEYFSCSERLDQLLHALVPGGGREENPFAELDKLYTQILSFCPPSLVPLLVRIFGFMVLSDRPTTPSEIEDILRLSQGQVSSLLRGLHSLIKFNDNTPLEPFHKSFPDFLLDNTRAGLYHLDEGEWWDTCSCTAFQTLREDLNLLKHSDCNDSSQIVSWPWSKVSMRLRFLENIQFPAGELHAALLKLMHDSVENDHGSECFAMSTGTQYRANFQALALLLVTLDLFLKSIKVKLCDYNQWTVIYRLTTICDLVLHDYFSVPRDPEMTLCIEAAVSLGSTFVMAAEDGPPGISPIQLRHDIPHIFEVPLSVFHSEDVKNIVEFIVYRSVRTYLKSFLTDFNRSGTFGGGPAIRDARMIYCLLRWMMGSTICGPTFVDHQPTWMRPYHIVMYSGFGHLPGSEDFNMKRMIVKKMYKEQEVGDWMNHGVRSSTVVHWLRCLCDRTYEEILYLCKCFACFQRDDEVVLRQLSLWDEQCSEIIKQVEKVTETDWLLVHLPFYQGSTVDDLLRNDFPL